MLFRSATLLCTDTLHFSGRRLTDGFQKHATNFIQRHPRYFRTRAAVQSSRNNGTTVLSQLGKPFAFTVAFSSTCSIGSAIWEYESFQKKREQLLKSVLPRFRRSHQNTSQNNNPILAWLESLPEGMWLFGFIGGPCILITLLYPLVKRRPNLLQWFCKYFICSPNPSNPGQVCPSLLLSSFCHLTPAHLFFNMFALASFMNVSVHQFGKEQTLGLYLTGAVISSFGSLAFKVIKGIPNGSCGASGALFALVTMFIINNPDAKLSLIFLPMFHFPAGAGLACLVAFDFMGVLMRWSYLDHVGHLTGALTGLVWHHFWPAQRRYIMDMWEKLKRH